MFIHDLKSTSESRMQDFEHEATVRQSEAAFRREYPSTTLSLLAAVRRIRFRSPIHLQPRRVEPMSNPGQSAIAQ